MSTTTVHRQLQKPTASHKLSSHGLPTGAQLKKLYVGLAKQRLSADFGKALRGPPVSNPNSYPHYNMTPRGLMDVTKTLFVIDNHLIYRTSGMGPGGISSRWRDLGPAPLF